MRVSTRLATLELRLSLRSSSKGQPRSVPVTRASSMSARATLRHLGISAGRPRLHDRNATLWPTEPSLPGQRRGAQPGTLCRPRISLQALKPTPGGCVGKGAILLGIHPARRKELSDPGAQEQSLVVELDLPVRWRKPPTGITTRSVSLALHVGTTF